MKQDLDALLDRIEAIDPAKWKYNPNTENSIVWDKQEYCSTTLNGVEIKMAPNGGWKLELHVHDPESRSSISLDYVSDPETAGKNTVSKDYGFRMHQIYGRIASYHKQEENKKQEEANAQYRAIESLNYKNNLDAILKKLE